MANGLNEKMRMPIWLILSGLIHGLATPPLNHELHWILFPVPLISIAALLPFISLIYAKDITRPLLRCWIWGVSSLLATMWWLTNVSISGLWLLIVLGMFLLSAFLGLWYLLLGWFARCCIAKRPQWGIVVIPALWVFVDFLRSLGDISFPWMFEGYTLATFLPIAQLASVTGIWGLTFLAVSVAVLAYEYLFCGKRSIARVVVYGISLFLLLLWGTFRIQRPLPLYDTDCAVVQSNIDQTEWDGQFSLERSMEIIDSMVRSDIGMADWYVLPESGVFTYLDHREEYRWQVLQWASDLSAPIIVGTLDFVWNDDKKKINYYNAAFLAQPREFHFEKYYKQRLVPFAEKLPFTGIIPLLSRANLGSADFSVGEEKILWNLHDSLVIAPLICYESIYPQYVRSRVLRGADVLVNITNDGWFGYSHGPYHHATMSVVRAIENGVSLIRCANSGISFVANPFGQYSQKSSLYTREILHSAVARPLDTTFYRRFGDWFVWVCGIVSIASLLVPSYFRNKTGKVPKNIHDTINATVRNL